MIWNKVNSQLKRDLLHCEQELKIIKVYEWTNTLDELTFGIVKLIENLKPQVPKKDCSTCIYKKSYFKRLNNTQKLNEELPLKLSDSMRFS